MKIENTTTAHAVINDNPRTKQKLKMMLKSITKDSTGIMKHQTADQLAQELVETVLVDQLGHEVGFNLADFNWRGLLAK
jgi:hypothetical protein